MVTTISAKNMDTLVLCQKLWLPFEIDINKDTDKKDLDLNKYILVRGVTWSTDFVDWHLDWNEVSLIYNN